MKINKHNLTIVEHCATKELNGYLTNGLQFNKTGTVAINRCYSVAVSALQVAEGEPRGCITPESARELLKEMGDGERHIVLSAAKFMKGIPPVVKLPENPPIFEMTLSANFLLKLAQSARDFTGPEDAIMRIQFTGPADPVRLDARNSRTGQKWEALVMPRIAGEDAARFAEPQIRPATPEEIQVQREGAYRTGAMRGERQAIPVPPPPPAEPANDFDAAMVAAQKLMGM